MSRARLLHLFDRMEREQRTLLAELDALPAIQLERAPPQGGWTVAQVIMHLAVVEEGAMAYLAKKLHYKKHERVGALAGLRLLILNTGIRLPVKYKAPAAVADVPPSSYAEARARWGMARERLVAAYTGLPEEQLTHDLFKHPFMGRFNPAQALRFLRLHMRRHIGQIRRTLAAQ